MAEYAIDKFTYNNNTYNLNTSIPYGSVDSTSTSTAFTATVPRITQLKDGVCMLLHNGVVTSASGFTVNINGLGAKPVYNNMTNATRDTTIFNVAYTMLFIYSSSLNSGSGGWWCYRGYDANTNTIGYQLRTNNTARKVSDTARYYKIYFSSADGLTWVPASVNSTNNATSTRAVNQRPIDPFGRIVYTSANTNYTAGTALAATTIWDQYNLTLGYSFNRTGEALTLTTDIPVYLKCAPQTDGSAIMDASTPIVQAFPSTNDGKIYILLGIATSATQMELIPRHPVYYHDGTGIREWVGTIIPTKTSDLTNDSGFVTNTGQITIESNSYPITSRMVTRISGVEGIAVGYDDGTTEGGMVFLPDGIGMNAVKTAIEAQIPTNIVNTITTTAGAHTTISNQEGDINFNVPTTAAHVGALSTSGGTITGNTTISGTDTILNLYAPAATNSGILRFQRGELNDNYNDWQIQDRGGYLYFDERGSGSTSWTNRAWIDTSGIIHASGFTGSGANLTDITKTATVSLTVAGWSSSTQTITATGVTASNNVIISPAPASMDAYAGAGVKCTAQAANSLTFTCTSIPSEAITVNVIIIK